MIRSIINLISLSESALPFSIRYFFFRHPQQQAVVACCAKNRRRESNWPHPLKPKWPIFVALPLISVSYSTSYSSSISSKNMFYFNYYQPILPVFYQTSWSGIEPWWSPLVYLSHTGFPSWGRSLTNSIIISSNLDLLSVSKKVA